MTALDPERALLADALVPLVDGITSQAVAEIECYTIDPAPGRLEEAARLFTAAAAHVRALHKLAHSAGG